MIQSSADPARIEIVVHWDFSSFFSQLLREGKLIWHDRECQSQIGKLQLEPIEFVVDLGGCLALIATDDRVEIFHLVDFVLAKLSHVDAIVILI